ncbi:immunoglobulin-like domain-containing protein [Winogradskyella jejuensis]|uniref:Por secretion system C-terminal sorting domain-containing protein n=1 Tax=Winogradskyella jejuensis TaxID=1089305 RepID=A0A1M5MLG9_9FLAO|nr:immunoglobulin-like domain-containing protein [Winogradskyella jejuensis]SHG78096.1 Por secretion system C-terminal sorting domain-containing protein [Winogradskyella jejuensis]
MTKKLRVLTGGITVLLLAIGIFTFVSNTQETNLELTIEEQRAAHEAIVANSPFKETLKWDKRKRKKEGLPPNRYFEQMWELTVNPSTGKLDDGELTILREEIAQQRASERNPGEAGNDWDERGPNDIGGRTRAILFDPNDATNNTVYAGGVSGGLWKNTNITSSSSQWQRVENVPGNLSVTSITVDPNNSNRWYVGTGEQYTAGDVVGNGVYVTNDGGNSWTSVNIPPAGPGTFEFNASNLFLSGIFYVNDVVAWNNGGNTELFVGVGAHVYGDSSSPTNWLGLQTAGLYRSTDGGSTWGRIETPNLQFDFSGTAYPVIPNDFEIGADGKLWMGTITTPGIGGGGGGRVFSTTNGSTWTEAGASPLTDSNRVEIAVSSTNANKMYALTQGVSSPVHVYTTTNGFNTISSGALPNDADQGIPANDFCRGQAFYDLMIEVDPNNDNILYVGGIDLFRSTNSAGSWTQISKWSNNPGLNTLSAPLVHADQHAMTFRPGNSNQAVFGNDGGIYYASSLSTASSNGSAIGVRNNNYNVTQYVKAGIGPNGSGSTNVIFTAGAQDNGSQAFRNGNAAPGINGSEELSDGDGFYTFVDKDGQYMIATFVNNVIYRFNLPWNGLGRRQGGATTLASSQTTGDFVNQMDYDSDANRLLTNNSSGSSFSIRSINVASNSSGTFTNAALTAKPTAFRASPFANNVWYVGLANGGLVRLSNVTNNSATFTTINTPFVGSVSSVRYGETANDIFVTIHNYGVTSVWATSNGGSSWQNKEGDLPNIPVRDMLQNPLNRNEAILATQLGVWSTSNFNSSSPNWTQAYNGMSDASVTSFDYWAVNGDDNNNQIIASTYGRGVFTGTFTATTVPDTEAPSAPTSLAASNTTQSSTDLSWTASTDNVGVSGYDVLRDGAVIASVSGTTTNYQVTGLTPNTAYAFSVRASDASGNQSVASNVINVTTDAPDTTAPSAPTSLSASGVTASSANLSWTASTDNVGVASYDILRDGVVVGNSTSTAFAATGLTAETQYSFSVVAKDAAGNTSGASNVVTITTDALPVTYCASQSSNVNDEYISRVQLNTIDNTSGAQFYSDFTSISTTLTKGNQYTVTITPTWTGTLYNEGYSVWIDYNRDGDFTDVGEQVFTDAPSQTNPVSGSFTVPTSASEVVTRMRVTMSYNANVDSCASFTYGEVEDYTIVIEGEGPDTEAPVVTLNGASTIDLNVGEAYNELGATATDNVDGNLTSSIVTSGTVNTNVAGTYTVTYTVTDAAGNSGSAIRTVNVIADTTPPVITLNGSANITLELQQTYNEQGATATDNIDGNLTSSIVISGTVNTNVAGTYTVTYSVSDAAGNSASTSRTVTVNPDTTAPVISLNGAATINLNVGDTYNELGATATDNIDGNLTSSIVTSGTVNTNTAGTYTVTYSVSDAAGNSASISRSVVVSADTIAPIITLNGSATVNLTVGDAYSDAGATASDNIDGNLTASIVVSGSVNTNVAGTYTLTYNVSDAAGNAATPVSRTVNVNEAANGCSGGISTFPYAEGFEGGIGAWTQSNADDINWTVDANGTPSNNTGPSSAVQGSNYIYVEASGNGTGFPNKRAIITSPCFDLSTVTEANFSFKYHMFGSTNGGSVDLEVTNDEGATWTSLWNQTGNQGNQWLTVNIDLAPYIGSGIQLRFNRITGGTWQSDVAIDDISLTEGVPTTPSCSGGVSSFPYAQGFEGSIGDWSQSSADDLNWTVDANGTPSNGTGPSSAIQGSDYIFVEASGNGTGYPNKRAIITSPCYDLSAQSGATFTFNYHMNGATDMGSIALEASNDNGASWTTLWSETGDKTNAWLSQSVDLSAYAGNSVQLRFNRVTGSTWQADIAIDNINLSAGPTTKAEEVLIDLTDDIQTIENSVRFYPNPASSSVNVGLGMDMQNGAVDMTLKIYDLTGKMVQQVQWSVDTITSEKSIDISGLNSGIYMLNIQSSNGMNKIQKLMKR